jgi:hypothetical protein
MEGRKRTLSGSGHAGLRAVIMLSSPMRVRTPVTENPSFSRNRTSWPLASPLAWLGGTRMMVAATEAAKIMAHPTWNSRCITP